MPPRKSTASVVDADTSMAVSAAGASLGTPDKKDKDKDKDKDRDGLGVEDLGLPKTMVQRLAKGVLPPNTQIQKDAQTAIWRSATVFVNYLASSANENAHRASKKTIQPQDVLDAIKDLEFDSFVPRLEAELAKHNALQTEKRNSYRKKIRSEHSTSTPGAEVDGRHSTNNNGEEVGARGGLIQASRGDQSVGSSPESSGGIPFDNPYATSTGASNQASRMSSGGAGAKEAKYPNAGFENVSVVIPPTVKVAPSKQKHDEEPSAKKARRNTIGEEDNHDSQEDVDMDDEEEIEEDEDDFEDDEEEEEEEEEEPVQRLAEDLLEEREQGDVGDEAIDGDESD